MEAESTGAFHRCPRVTLHLLNLDPEAFERWAKDVCVQEPVECVGRVRRAWLAGESQGVGRHEGCGRWCEVKVRRYARQGTVENVKVWMRWTCNG